MEGNTDAKVSVVIAAAGKGTRMNMDLNKQYVDICGKPVLARTIQLFEDLSATEEIIIVVNTEDIEFCRREIVEKYSFGKVKAIVPGGSARQESVYNGLRHMDPSSGIVLVHDGARPFASSESIMDSIAAAREYGAACVAVPVKDTIKSADTGGFVQVTLDRGTLWSIQTPQAFKRDLLLKAYDAARADGYYGTDDAVLVERLGYMLKLVNGSYFNIKITTREDLAFAQAIAGILDGR